MVTESWSQRGTQWSGKFNPVMSATFSLAERALFIGTHTPDICVPVPTLAYAVAASAPNQPQSGPMASLYHQRLQSADHATDALIYA